MKVRLSTCTEKGDSFKAVGEIPVGAVFEGIAWKASPVGVRLHHETRVFVKVWNAVIQISRHRGNSFEFVSVDGVAQRPCACKALKFSDYKLLGTIEVTD